MSMDKLVDLFLQSARPEGEAAAGGVPFGGEAPDEEAIERGVSVVEKMLMSEDAMKMGIAPSATFVCLGMAMEEKPKLTAASLRFYEKALEYHSRRPQKDGSAWERAVVLQQLGAVGLRLARPDTPGVKPEDMKRRLEDAQRWLGECAKCCRDAPGHPRDIQLFEGAFNTSQTRMEFAATVEKMLAQTFGRMGDTTRAYAHLEESQRLEKLAKGDAVERQAQLAASSNGSSTAKAATAATTAASPQAAPNGPSVMGPKELWAAEPAETRRLKEYRYMDKGPHVFIILELNEHLGIGTEASEVVLALQQFKVQCEPTSVDVQLRLRRLDGQVLHFNLVLAPLCKEIVPEDTVPKLLGRANKRRLELMLFKRDKQQTWYGDIVKDAPPPKRSERGAQPGQAAAPASAKGSLLNPLSAEELARLPTPSGGSGDNRPSSFQQAAGSERQAPPPAEPRPQPKAVPAAPSSGSAEPAPAAPGAAASANELSSAGSCGETRLPAWISGVEERRSADAVELLVQFGQAAGDALGMQDLELDADPVAGVLRLRLLSLGGSGDDAVELRPPRGADMANLAPKWRRKARTLELRFLDPC